MNKRLYIVIWSLLCLSTAYGQRSSPEIISSAGETYQGTNLQIDWTLGELAITTIQNSTQQITQGFHQPVYIITDVTELPDLAVEVKVFPNPTVDQISIELTFEESQKVEIQLFNLEGKIINTKLVEGQQIVEQKSMKDLPAGQYFLTLLIKENQLLRTYKIQKVN